jgi:hypothetical protein
VKDDIILRSGFPPRYGRLGFVLFVLFGLSVNLSQASDLLFPGVSPLTGMEAQIDPENPDPSELPRLLPLSEEADLTSSSKEATEEFVASMKSSRSANFSATKRTDTKEENQAVDLPLTESEKASYDYCYTRFYTPALATPSPVSRNFSTFSSLSPGKKIGDLLPEEKPQLLITRKEGNPIESVPLEEPSPAPDLEAVKEESSQEEGTVKSEETASLSSEDVDRRRRITIPSEEMEDSPSPEILAYQELPLEKEVDGSSMEADAPPPIVDSAPTREEGWIGLPPKSKSEVAEAENADDEPVHESKSEKGTQISLLSLHSESALISSSTPSAEDQEVASREPGISGDGINNPINSVSGLEKYQYRFDEFASEPESQFSADAHSKGVENGPLPSFSTGEPKGETMFSIDGEKNAGDASGGVARAVVEAMLQAGKNTLSFGGLHPMEVTQHFGRVVK